ncbi:MAG: DUF3352 domain-containing protein [Mycobacteriales bacterium]
MRTFGLLAARRSRRPGRRAISVGTAALLATAVLGANAAYATVVALDGGGAQPEDVLPSTVLALAKVDMDPAFGQKRALLQLSRKFPKSSATTTGGLKDNLLRSVFDGSDFNYERDIKPWVGQRAAVGAIADATADSGFSAIAAIQYNDAAVAREGLKRITAAQVRARSQNRLFFARKNGYVLVAETQAHIDAAFSSTQPLSSVDGYREAMASLSGDQIATAWVNLRATFLATPAEDRKLVPVFSSLKRVPTGHFVVGLHAASSYLEVQGKAVGTNEETDLNMYGGVGLGPGANLLANYPADTWAAIDMTGLGDALVRYYHSSGLDKDPDVAAAAEEYGITLPADIKTLFGDETAVGVFGNGDGIQVVMRVLSTTPSASAGVATKILTAGGGSRSQISGLVRTEKDGYFVGSSKAAVVKAATTTAHLGETVSFRRALPEAAGAGISVYINVQGTMRAFEADAATRYEYRYVDAFGFTMNPATKSFRMRLTVK